jgi:hypothetical protein
MISAHIMNKLEISILVYANLEWKICLSLNFIKMKVTFIYKVYGTFLTKFGADVTTFYCMGKILLLLKQVVGLSKPLKAGVRSC